MAGVMFEETGRRAAAGVTAAVLAAGLLLAGAGRAAAQPVLYAAASPMGAADCSSPGNACDLSTALSDVAAGGVIELVTPGSSAHYVGNWTVTTTGTSASAPVTIEAEPGLPSAPVLDGNQGSPTGCSTTSCDGPVLAVSDSRAHVTLAQFAIINGDNVTPNNYTGLCGGGLSVLGTVTVTGLAFTDDAARDYGGAICSVRTGQVSVTGSTFTHNTAEDGGAISNGVQINYPGTSVSVNSSTFTDNTAVVSGGAIEDGDFGGGGKVTVAGSTFTGNGASSVSGGAIDIDGGGDSSLTVSGSTFTANNASQGGAIGSDVSGAGLFGGSAVTTVTGSTFTGNFASDNGGAIDNGYGVATVTSSTFGPGNSAPVGNAIINGHLHGGGGTLSVAADIFAGSCDQASPAVWDDGGYNAGTDGSCFNNGTGDAQGSAGDLGPLAWNGGPTQTMAPTAGNPALGLIPNGTSTTVGGSTTQLCPATDQRGYATQGANCDAGAVQTSGSPLLGLTTQAYGTGWRQAGDVIDLGYQVTNNSGATVTGVGIADLAGAVATCPLASLPAGGHETCFGAYTVTAQDVSAGRVSDLAAAYGLLGNGALAGSADVRITVPEDWPAVVAGVHELAASAPEGYYLGTSGSPWDRTWALDVTHPGRQKVAFTGTITLHAGRYTWLKKNHLESNDTVRLTGPRTLSFGFTDAGGLDGIRFITTPAATSITFTLDINGQPAQASHIYLGHSATQASSGSPLTFTR